MVRGETPVRAEFIAFVEAKREVGVADVNGEEHACILPRSESTMRLLTALAYGACVGQTNNVLAMTRFFLWHCRVKGSKSAQDDEDEPEVVDHQNQNKNSYRNFKPFFLSKF